MTNVVHFRNSPPYSGWFYTQNVLRNCEAAVPKEKQHSWIEKVACGMCCHPHEIIAFLQGDRVADASIRERLMLAAIYAIEPLPQYRARYTD